MQELEKFVENEVTLQEILTVADQDAYGLLPINKFKKNKVNIINKTVLVCFNKMIRNFFI